MRSVPSRAVKMFRCWTFRREIILLQSVLACFFCFLLAGVEMKLVEHSFGGIMKGCCDPCSRTKVANNKANSEPMSSEVLNIYSVTYEYKPKPSAGLFSLLFSCKEREGGDLPAILLLRDFNLVCWSCWWGISINSVITWSSAAFRGRLLRNS